jgi:hypothetical protein
MKELIEILNDTSGVRVMFYAISFIFLVGVTLDGIAGIINSFRK